MKHKCSNVNNKNDSKVVHYNLNEINNDSV